MDHYKNIYTNHAEAYHQLIAAEDHNLNLLPAMEKVMPFSGKSVLDLGSGTGRIPLLLHKQARKIISLDLHWAMLLEQDSQKEQTSADWDLIQGDMRVLPFPDRSFDVVTAGWALGHFTDWYPNDWEIQIANVLKEMKRIVIPGGALIVIETLTTGSDQPAPPTLELAHYYTCLEEDWGFSRKKITTDYQFSNLENAVELTTTFFGGELGEKVRKNNWIRLPEWTGVWGKKIGST